jgi:DNA replication protein DnaC
MVDREVVERQNKCLATRLKFARLRQMAVVEDIDLATPRGLDRALFTSLVAGDWIERKLNLLIIGPTGVGKSWIACALGHKACRDDRSVLYHRLPRLLEALALARGDGRLQRNTHSRSRQACCGCRGGHVGDATASPRPMSLPNRHPAVQKRMGCLDGLSLSGDER